MYTPDQIRAAGQAGEISSIDVEPCGIMFGRNDFGDVTGCLKPYAHNDFHICKTRDGRFMAWEDDYKCTCGCWNEEYNDVCRIYWEVDKNSLNQ
jgi:hypothetical protein